MSEDGSLPSNVATSTEKVDVEGLSDTAGHFDFEQTIEKEGQPVVVRWTAAEQRALVRKGDIFLLPIFTGASRSFPPFASSPCLAATQMLPEPEVPPLASADLRQPEQCYSSSWVSIEETSREFSPQLSSKTPISTSSRQTVRVS